MSPRDDQAWLDALAGRDEDERASRDAAEAALLRAALLARPRPDAETVRATDPQREAELINRARALGLIDTRPGPPRSARGWRRLAVAATLVLAAGLGLWLAQAPEPTVRDSAPTIRLEADDPAALQRQILGELEAAGLDATGYERLGRYGIDADLPQPVPADVRRVLRTHRIAVPPDGVLRIEITAAETP